MNQEALVERLAAIVGADKVRTDEESLDTFGKDWTKVWPPKPSAIVFPKTTEQVRDIVLFANEHKIALVPSGGRTGLSAGAMATNGEVVVAFDYMNQIQDFNAMRSEEHTSELQSRRHLVCRLLLEKKKT